MTQTTVSVDGTAGRRLAGSGLTLALAVAGTALGTAPAHAHDHTVQPGETVSHIALRSGTTVAAIREANGLGEDAWIRAGQTLVVPAAPRASAAPAHPAPAGPVVHTVVTGDTVSALARQYGSSVAAISAANGLDAAAFIRAGQSLTIPAGSGGAAGGTTVPGAVAADVAHTVVPGDTVWQLAERYGAARAAIVEANALDSSATIRVGQTLRIPQAAGAAASASGAAVGSTFEGRTYPAATVASANQNKATLVAAGVPSREAVQALIVETARSMGVDPALAQAVAYQESGFNQAAVSPANAIGAMQVIPTSGQWASDLVGRDLNLLVAEDNVVAGVAILRQLVATSDDLPTAIAGYYQGQAGVRKYGMFEDTRRYVDSVQALMSRFA